MNKIKQLLYKYLDENSIKLIGMGQKIEDPRWLIDNGYQEDFPRHDKAANLAKALKASASGGKITPKGEKFFKKYDSEIERLLEKTKNVSSYENEEKTRRAIQSFIKKNRYNYSLKGLTEDEKFAFMYFSQNPLDSGRR